MHSPRELRRSAIAAALWCGLVALVALATPARLDAAALVRGPYLQNATDTSIVIRWRTDLAVTSEVLYGGSPMALSLSASSSALGTEHEIEVGGLAPETRYYYAVGPIGEPLTPADENHSFQTSPVPGADRPTRIWILGDSGTANVNAAAVRDAFLNYPGGPPANVWLMLGDNAYNTGTDLEYQAAVFDMYSTILRNTPLWPTRGNHDILHTGSWNDYYDIFTMPVDGEAGGLASASEAYYSYDFGDVHFVCLDSEGSSRAPLSPMLTWLAADLAATERRWIVAYWHHPPYTKGSHDSDNPGDSGGRMRDMRQNVLPILEAGGVDLVLTGHSHSYERSFLLDEHYGLSATLHDSMKVDAGDGREDGDGAYQKTDLPHAGAVYAVAGSSGLTGGGPLDHPVMFISLNLLGSMVLDVSGDRMDAVFLDATGTQRDHFTLRKTVVVDAGPRPAASRLYLSPPVPNPGTTSVRFDLEMGVAGTARLAVFDAAGRLVAELLEGHLEPGLEVVVWNGRDAAGRLVPPGLYYAALEAWGERRVRKVTWTR